MTDLDPKARALIQASRLALRPSAADRARSEAALRERLGSNVLTSDGDAKPSSSLAWRSVVGIALGVCVLGAVAFLALRPASSSPAPRARPAAVLPPTAAPPAALLEPPTDPTPLSSAPPTRAHEALTPPVRDPLAREVTLLSRATRALHAGRTAAALKTLDEHQRKFPDGVLTEERRAAKAQALCALGRIAEGRAELARLTPHSPSAARAEQFCDSPPSAAESIRSRDGSVGALPLP
jgi:hypothetical protein